MTVKFTKLFALILLGLFMVANDSFSKELTKDEIRDALPQLLGSTNAGTEFYITFHPCWEETGANNALRIYVSSGEATQVTLDIEALGYTETKTTVPNDIIEFRLDPTIGQMYSKDDREPPLPEDVWEGRGIKLTANSPIIVYGVTRYQYTSDGFLAIPTSALGREYIVASWGDPINDAEEDRIQWLTSYTSIVAIYDNTRVRFTLGGPSLTTTPGGMIKGRPEQEMMDAGDVWLIPAQGPSADLSGSIVRADKPVAVISGSFCAYVPEQIAACDFIIEQDLPSHTWGTKYHLSPIVKRTKNSWIKVFPKQRQTTIYRDGLEWALIPQAGGVLDDGYIKRRANGGEKLPFTFSGDGPFTMTQWNPGQQDDNVESDPFQMVLTPIEQYQTEIVFNTPGIKGGFSFDEDYINIVYKSTEDGGIPDHIEFAKVENGKFVYEQLNVLSGAPGEAFADAEITDDRYYYSKTYELQDQGVYRLRSEEPFAAYAYGFSSYDSYGFPTSVALADLEVPDTVAPNPTWTIDCLGNVPSQDEENNPNNVPARVIDMPDDAEFRSNLGLILFLQNQSYNYDFTYEPFVPGNDRITEWSLRVRDISRNARAVIRFSDRAGNDTLIDINYFTTDLRITPTRVDYGLFNLNGQPKTETFTLTNASDDAPATVDRNILKSVQEQFDDTYFDLDLGNLTLGQTLQPGEAVDFNVTFTPQAEGLFVDSVGTGDDCIFYYQAEVRATVGTPRINVTDVRFGDVVVGNQAQPIDITVSNNGTVPLTISGYNVQNGLNVYTYTGLEQVDLNNPNVSVSLEVGESQTFQVDFVPDAVAEFVDFVEFISNDPDPTVDPKTGADYGNYGLTDLPRSTALITGRGIQPRLTVNSYDWGEVRASLERYAALEGATGGEFVAPEHYPAPAEIITLENPGSFEVQITGTVLGGNSVNAEAFYVMINGEFRSLSDQNVRNQVFNKTIPRAADENTPATLNVPVYFFPEVDLANGVNHRGNCAIEIEFESTAQEAENPVSLLQGIGLYPEVAGQGINFTEGGPFIVGSAAVVRDQEFTNEFEDIDFSDELTIYGLEFSNPALVTNDPNALGNPGGPVFYYEEPEFPITLSENQLEGVLTFPVTFETIEAGQYEVTVTTITDAIEESSVVWEAVSIDESFETEPANIVTCFTNPVLIDSDQGEDGKPSITNTGSTPIEITEVFIRNTDGTAYTGGEFNIMTGVPFNLAPDQEQTIDIMYTPAATTPQTTYELVFVTDAVSVNLQEQVTEISVTAVEYELTTEATINNAVETMVLPGADDVLYEVFISNQSGADLSEASVSEITLQIEYDKEFLAADVYSDNGNPRPLLDPVANAAEIADKIRLGQDFLNSDFSVVALTTNYDNNTRMETISITLQGTPIDLAGGAKVLELDFTPFLPYYEQGASAIEKEVKETTITHTVVSGDACIAINTTQEPTVGLEPVCVDEARPITISSTEFNLGNVFPNPVGSSGADIPFSVGYTTDVEIIIYNVAGEVVAHPVSDRLSTGEYNVSIPVENLSTGVYYYEMQSGPYKEVKKLVIQK